MAKAQMQNAARAEAQELQPELVSIMKEEVVKAKDKKLPIIRAFEAVAQKTGLKSTTIRNYYYRYLQTQGASKGIPSKADEMRIQDQEAIGKPFAPDETKELMKIMLAAQARGESVRGCANRLSGGDKRVLIRLQNKYRSIIAREPEYVVSVMDELKAQGVASYNPYTQQPEKRSYRSAGSGVCESTDELVALMSQFTVNMKGIGGTMLQDFVKGLRDMSSLAFKGAKRGPGPDKILAEKERALKELTSRLTVLEAKVQKERMEADSERSMLRNLMHINRRFLELSDAEKLSDLNGYIDRLRSSIQN